MSKEHPILFIGESVRGVLADLKKQTRRIIKPQPPCSLSQVENTGLWTYTCCEDDWKCPYGKAGDVLWVREKWQPLYDYCNYDAGIVGACFRHRGGCRVFSAKYKPHMHIDDTYNFKPAIHMPKWACRLRLKVKSVRVERVQDISEEDIIAEGVCKLDIPHAKKKDLGWYYYKPWRELWDSINKKRGHGWEKNNWVWVIEFERIDE